jgi:hypothetical protein
MAAGLQTPWSSIESADPAKLIANLRALGCPEATIRDLIPTRLGRAYRDRLIETEAESVRAWNYVHARTDWRERTREQADLRGEMQTKLER